MLGNDFRLIIVALTSQPSPLSARGGKPPSLSKHYRTDSRPFGCFQA